MNPLFTMRRASELGGEVLLRYWGKLPSVEHKELAGDLVTLADKESELAILTEIRNNHPDHAILAEESGAHEGKESEYLWVIDPLDGTTNYAHNFPVVAVSIALLHHGVPILGTVYNPFSNEKFEAIRGEGATLNGVRISVSSTERLSSALLATGFAYNRRERSDNNYREFAHLTDVSQGVRRLGSAALDLAYVADGRLDGYWELGLRPWDVAAGALLVHEAGGLVTGYDNSPLDIYSGYILASNSRIHSEIIQELKKA